MTNVVIDQNCNTFSKYPFLFAEIKQSESAVLLKTWQNGENFHLVFSFSHNSSNFLTKDIAIFQTALKNDNIKFSRYSIVISSSRFFLHDTRCETPLPTGERSLGNRAKSRVKRFFIPRSSQLSQGYLNAPRSVDRV